ncbi:MAG: hypothetical protein RR942_03760 [Romboutsia sp.]
MKDTNICPKCNSRKIKKVKSLPFQIENGIIPKRLNPYYYICTKCGYAEIWIADKDELEYISKNK